VHFLETSTHSEETWVNGWHFAESVLRVDSAKLSLFVSDFEPYLRVLGPITPTNAEPFAIRLLLWLSKELPLRSVPPFACYVLYLLQPGGYRLVEVTTAFTELCALIGYMARVSDEARECLDEYHLFRKVAGRFGESPSTVSYCICPFVENQCMWAPTTLVLPVSHWVCCNYDREDYQVKLLMASFPPLFLPLMIPSLVVLVKRIWRWGPVDWSPVLASCLRGPSVELVLRLEAENALQPLVSRCKAECMQLEAAGAASIPSSWKEVKAHLERHWPGRTKDTTDRSVSLPSQECPITLSPIVDAAVASDGHVYERDAILLHMSKDMRSPLTRETLSYSLFPLYGTPSSEQPQEGGAPKPPLC